MLNWFRQLFVRSGASVQPEFVPVVSVPTLRIVINQSTGVVHIGGTGVAECGYNVPTYVANQVVRDLQNGGLYVPHLHRGIRSVDDIGITLGGQLALLTMYHLIRYDGNRYQLCPGVALSVEHV